MEIYLTRLIQRKSFEINARYSDLGPRMIESGVIDLEKFKQTYEKSAQPLTKEQLEILTKDQNKKSRLIVTILIFTQLFLGSRLANKSKALTAEGDIVKYGEGQVGNFASTGGWVASKTHPMDYYAKGLI